MRSFERNPNIECKHECLMSVTTNNERKHVREWMWGPNLFISNKFFRIMFHKYRSCGYGDNTINTKLLSFHGKCSFMEYLKWEKTIEWVFDCNFYSEQKKIQLATSTFIEDSADWWDEEWMCRHFYGERPLDTWYERQRCWGKDSAKTAKKSFVREWTRSCLFSHIGKSQLLTRTK